MVLWACFVCCAMDAHYTNVHEAASCQSRC